MVKKGRGKEERDRGERKGSKEGRELGKNDNKGKGTRVT